jgi:addiction module HigA family antidote
MAKTPRLLDPISPGEILLEEFMRPNGISQNRLARDIDVNPARVNDIVHGRSAITASIALRLAKYFGTTPELWLNLQSDYDLRRARAKDWPKTEPRVRVLAAECWRGRGACAEAKSHRHRRAGAKRPARSAANDTLRAKSR